MMAAMAARGFTAIGADKDTKRIVAIETGDLLLTEPRLSDCLEAGRGKWSLTSDTGRAAQQSDITFVIVPTPSNPDGWFSNDHILEACAEIGAALADKDDYHIVVITSTVMPGSMDGVIRQTLEGASGLTAGKDFGLCYSPEFIALGAVIEDFLNPDFVLIGESDGLAGAELSDLYRALCENDPPIVRINLVNAELAKLALNAYVCTKITYANYLAQLCGRLPGGDVRAVTRTIGLDSRIGLKCLRGGLPYGGPCFPRDTVALSALSESLGVACNLPVTVSAMNRNASQELFDLVSSLGSPGSIVAVLGIAYKMGTHITEESAALKLVELLELCERTVIMHDPYIPETDGAQNCVDVASIVVLALPYEEFGRLEFRPGQIIVDCWQLFEEAPPGTKYIALGRWRDR